MLNNFYYKLTREQCEKLLKDEDFANKKGLLGLKIGNLTEDELTETFNFIKGNFKDTFVYYEPTNKNGETLDIFDILHDDFYNSQFKRIVDFSKTYKEQFGISVLLKSDIEKDFLEDESFKDTVRNFIDDKKSNSIPIFFYVKRIDALGEMYGYLNTVTELSIFFHGLEELYDFSALQDYMCQITVVNLPPLSKMIQESVIGHGWFARRAASKIMFSVYPKQDTNEIIERAFLALKNVLSSSLPSTSFILDLSILELDYFEKYLKKFEEKFLELANKMKEIEQLYRNDNIDKAEEEYKKTLIIRRNSGIFRGLEDYEYNDKIIFYSYGVGLPNFSRTIFSIEEVSGGYKKYLFKYYNSRNGVEITRQKSEEEYQNFLEELKDVTRNWTETSYFKQACDGFHEEIKCKDINLEIKLSNDYPERYREFKDILYRYFEPKTNNTPTGLRTKISTAIKWLYSLIKMS